MVEYWNMTGIRSANSMLNLTQQTDKLLGGFYFGWITLFILAFVTFVTLKAKGYTTSACFSVTCWFCMIISWLLRTMSLVDNYTMWGMVILTVSSVFILFLSQN